MAKQSALGKTLAKVGYAAGGALGLLGTGTGVGVATVLGGAVGGAYAGRALGNKITRNRYNRSRRRR